MPGMFSKTDEQTSSMTSNSHTIIGASLHIEGTIASEEDVVIAGKLSGSVQTSKNVTVHTGAHIDADVTAHDVMISGEVKGNVHAQGAVTLTATANVNGNITANTIAIESGAMLKGQIITERS